MWEYKNPTRIIFGEGSSERLYDIFDHQGYRRAVLFSRKILRLPLKTQQLIQSLSPRIVKIIDDIEPEPCTMDIDRAVEMMKGLDVDAVIAIGGGSVIDTAKAAAAAFANDCPVKEIIEQSPSSLRALPLIAVPTTSGTGSEVTRAAALIYKGKKRPIFDDSLYPYAALVDPELSYGCPPAVTASCGVDTLAHACESLMHRNVNPVSRLYGENALRLCRCGLEQSWAEPENKKARRAMSEAALMAGLAIASTGCSASHACSYMLSTDYGLPHGEACAFTLDKLVFLCLSHDGRLDKEARACGFGSGEALGRWISDLKKKFGFRSSLAELKADEAGRDRLVEAGYSSKILDNHYFTLLREDVEYLFK